MCLDELPFFLDEDLLFSVLTAGDSGGSEGNKSKTLLASAAILASSAAYDDEVYQIQ